MTQPFVVRRAVEEDASSLLSLRTRLFEQTEFMLWEPAEFKDTVDDERQRIARLNSQGNCACFAACADNQLVGFLNALGAKVNRLQHSSTLALGVLQEYWSRGIGHALLVQALEWARHAGLVRLELTVHTTNYRAIQLYLRAGFQVEGVRRRSLLVSGRYVDEYLMSNINEA